MDTRSKTNMEFRNKVNEALARHDTNFEELNHNFGCVDTDLQGVMTELQAMRNAQSNRTLDREVNPFAAGGTSHHKPSASTTPIPERNHTHFKLNFLTFAGDGEDPTAWIFKAEQYFEFQNIDFSQQVQLASFHMGNVVFQWYCWFTKNKGLMHWGEFTKALLHRFGPTDYDDSLEALSCHRQTTTINAYQETFEKLSHVQGK
jgi:hypothetical protein